MNGYLDSNGNYYEGERQLDYARREFDREVPQRPSPDHYPTFEEDDWTFREWVLDEARRKQELGRIPTNEFIERVFALPSNPPEDLPPNYTWVREDTIRLLSPAVSARLPKGGFIHGTRQEIEDMAGWMLTFKQIPNTYPPQFEQLEPGPDGYEGGIISQEEYGRVLALLDEYGVQ